MPDSALITPGPAHVSDRDGLRLRVAPATQAQVQFSLQFGEPVEVLPDSWARNDGFDWVKVRARETVGWCVAKFLTPGAGEVFAPAPAGLVVTAAVGPQPSSAPQPIPTPHSIAAAPSVPAYQPVSTHKIGLHLHMGTNPMGMVEIAKRLHAAGKPLPCVVVINEVKLANELADYVPVVVFRQVWGADDPAPDIPNDEVAAIEAGKRWAYGRHKPFNDAADRAHFLQFVNENRWLPFDYAFNLGLMQACEEMGRRAALFADYPGAPEVSQWQQRIPALRHAMAHGHIVNLHQYGPADRPSAPVSDAAGLQWFGARHRMFYDSVPEDSRPRLIIGECTNFSATFLGLESTLADMRSYNEILKQDPYIIGCCWWTVGGQGAFNWGHSSIDSILPAVEAAMLSF